MNWLLIVTRALAERLEQSEIDYMISRVNAIGQREGNPMGAEVRQFGGATAFYVHEMPWGSFNTVKGVREEHIDYIDEIISFFRERSRSFQFEITPANSSSELLSYLTDRGFRQSGFHTVLYGMPNAEEEPAYAAGIAIRELKADEFELYGKLHCLGTGLNVDGAGHVADNNRVLYDQPGWRFYIGFVDDQPAGVAVMYMHNSTASLTFAATIPAFRKRGLQTAFLHKRCYDAAIAQCDLVVSQAAYASISQNNMERAGLRIGYTRAVWTSHS
ncbi:GNAT family N-acetyltransferase [Paenibacillus sp. PR3]|uniref:GNAT family N-acetyltransferase n=1 Tax=Paenibacillus terricola TaxID=2763503 RepID=A0ABR8MTE4_9BACL|nr:GNAT family N-acetyltransferase [Paenibacillus terricola]MBD3917419.1 GNAT family N-acetyltransferase [Paenibacillus terricola]